MSGHSSAELKFRGDANDPRTFEFVVLATGPPGRGCTGWAAAARRTSRLEPLYGARSSPGPARTTTRPVTMHPTNTMVQ